MDAGSLCGSPCPRDRGDNRLPRRSRRRRGRVPARHRVGLTVVALGLWVALLVVARVWGSIVLHHASADLHVGAIPLFGKWQWLLTGRLFVPIAVGVALIVALPVIAERWSWGAVLAATAVFAVLLSAALAYGDPTATRWSSIHDDYGQHVERIDQHGLGGFLRDYVHGQATFPTHLQAHPPGMVVLLWVGAEAGLHGDGFETALALAGVVAAALAALIVAREVVNEKFARRAAPFVVLAPAAVWHTNADVVFAGVALSAVALIVVATGRRGRSQDRLAALGGLALGGALLLSYGVGLLIIPAAVCALWRRQPRVLVVAGAVAAMTLAVPVAWGYSWSAGLIATKHQYDLNLATVRPYWYFVLGNLAVFALAVGPAVAVGLTRLRERRAWLVVGAGLAVVVLADLTGLSSAETERIWQPLMPLVLLAGAAVATSITSARRWLGAQLVVTLLLQAALRSPW